MMGNEPFETRQVANIYLKMHHELNYMLLVKMFCNSTIANMVTM
jgi:hypothetical protein